MSSREKSKQQSFFDFFWWTSTHEKKRCQTRYIISVIQSREIVNCFEKIMISPKGKWKAIAAEQRRKRHAKNIKNLFTLARKKKVHFIQSVYYINPIRFSQDYSIQFRCAVLNAHLLYPRNSNLFRYYRLRISPLCPINFYFCVWMHRFGFFFCILTRDILRNCNSFGNITLHATLISSISFTWSTNSLMNYEDTRQMSPNSFDYFS